MNELTTGNADPLKFKKILDLQIKEILVNPESFGKNLPKNTW